MNWKKLIKYTAFTIFSLIVIALLWADRQGTLMYGGLTQKVNHEQFSPKTGSFAISNVNALASDGESFSPGQTVLFENGIITAIDSDLVLPAEVSIIDGAGKYLIPGLIDPHVHLFQSPNDLLLYIANGVTTIRELIGEEDHLRWRQEIENGRIGPRMFVASPRLGTFETMEGWFMAKTQGFLNIQNAEDAEETVKALHEQGYDGFKIYSHLNKESYLAVTKTAESLGMPVFGHIPWSIDFADVWQNGQSDIAHFEEVMNALQREFGYFAGKENEFLTFVEQRSEALADSLIANDISVTSTLWLTQSFVRQKVALEEVLKEVELAYENAGIIEGSKMATRALGWLPSVNRYRFPENFTEEEKTKSAHYWVTYGNACQLLVRNFAKKGVKIMAGTDANLPPTVPGFSLHDELGSLQQAGMTNTQVLKSATAVPATWLKINTGVISVGKSADLVLLDKNPLEDIRYTKAINTVIARGLVFDRILLDKLLAAVRKANDASRTISISHYEH